MAQSQAEKVRKNTIWKRTKAGQKSQKKVIENITERRKRGTYGKGGGDLSHPREGKPGYTMESEAENRGNNREKKKIARRNKRKDKRNKRKGFTAKYA